MWLYTFNFSPRPAPEEYAYERNKDTYIFLTAKYYSFYFLSRGLEDHQGVVEISRTLRKVLPAPRRKISDLPGEKKTCIRKQNDGKKSIL